MSQVQSKNFDILQELRMLATFPQFQAQKCETVRPNTTCKSYVVISFVIIDENNYTTGVLSYMTCYLWIIFWKFKSSFYSNFWKIIVYWSLEWVTGIPYLVEFDRYCWIFLCHYVRYEGARQHDLGQKCLFYKLNNYVSVLSVFPW